MNFGDYIIYVDESGDHSLDKIDENFPAFSLAFCIFRKTDYMSVAVPLMQDFKFRWFGHDTFVLHESDIVKRRFPFSFLQYDDLRGRFMQDLSNVMAQMPMTVIASVIRKDRLKTKYSDPDNPYELGLLFCLERSHEFMQSQGADGDRCFVVCESRSPREKVGRGREDAALELEFRRIVAADHYLQQRQLKPPMPCFDIVFASKLANSTGLQIADMIARPLALKSLRPDQENRAYDLIEGKFWRGPNGRSLGSGLKVFP